MSIDSTGDYTELYEQISDPLIARFLRLRSQTSRRHQRSPLLNPILSASPLLRKLYSLVPFAPNLTPPEFIPTKQLMLLDVLRDKFPAHRILFSDFSSLPDTIPGENAPVVQTRYEGEVSFFFSAEYSYILLDHGSNLPLFGTDSRLYNLSSPTRIFRHLLRHRFSSPTRSLRPGDVTFTSAVSVYGGSLIFSQSGF